MGVLLRIRQGISFFISFYTREDDRMARKYLTGNEYLVFRKMSGYDRKHSVSVAKDIERNELLCREKLIKFALLHDVGKSKKIGILKRVRHVLLKDVKELQEHPQKGFEILRGICPDIAVLTLHHHERESGNELIKVFQKYDDRH